MIIKLLFISTLWIMISASNNIKNTNTSVAPPLESDGKHIGLIGLVNKTFNFSGNRVSGRTPSLLVAGAAVALLPLALMVIYFGLIVFFPDPQSDVKFERDTARVVRRFTSTLHEMEDRMFDFFEDITDPNRYSQYPESKTQSKPGATKVPKGHKPHINQALHHYGGGAIKDLKYFPTKGSVNHFNTRGAYYNLYGQHHRLVPWSTQNVVRPHQSVVHYPLPQYKPPSPTYKWPFTKPINSYVNPNDVNQVQYSFSNTGSGTPQVIGSQIPYYLKLNNPHSRPLVHAPVQTYLVQPSSPPIGPKMKYNKTVFPNRPFQPIMVGKEESTNVDRIKINSNFKPTLFQPSQVDPSQQSKDFVRFES